MAVGDRNITLGTIFTGHISSSLRNSFNALNRAVGSTNTAMRNVNKTTKKTTASTKKQKKAVDQGKKSFQGYGKQISKVHGGMERLRAAFKVTAAYGIAARAIFGVVEAAQAGVAEIIAFDQAMFNIAAITGATVDELNLMRDVMIEVADKTKFSTTEIAQGIVLLGQSGFSAGEATNAIAAAANLAAGTLTDLGTTTDLLTTTIRAFSLEAIEAGRVADTMANAINKSKLTLDKIRTSFNFVGAAAAQVGLTIEQTTASMALLANNGLRASTIGTGLRQVLSRMIAPNRKLRDAFKEFGLEVKNINPKLHGFEVAMQNLTKILVKTDGVTVDMSKAFSLFGLRGAQAVAVLIKGFTGTGYKDMLNKMFEVGAAEKMAAIQARGLEFKLKNLTDKAKILAIAIGDLGLTGNLRDLVDVMRITVSGITAFVNSTGGGFILRIVGWSAAIGTLTGALILLGKALVYVIPLFLSFSGTPILAGIAAVAALVIGLKALTKGTESTIKAYGKQREEAKRNISSLEAYVGAIQSIIDETEEGNEVTKEHASLLERLAKAHPELAEVIEKSKKAYSSFKDVIEATNNALSDQLSAKIFLSLSQMKRTSNRIKEIQEEHAKLGEKIDRVYFTPAGPMVKGSFGLIQRDMKKFRGMETELANLEAEQIKNLDEATMATFNWSSSLKENIHLARINIESWVKSGTVTKEHADIILKNLIPALEKLNTLKGEKKGEAAAKVKKEDLKAELAYQSLLSRLSEDRMKKIEANFKRNLAVINKWKETEIERLEGVEKDKIKIQKDVNKKTRALIKLANLKKQLQINKFQLSEQKSKMEHNAKLAEIDLLENEKVIIDKNTSLKVIAKQRRENLIEIEKENVRILEEYFEKAKSIRTANGAEELRAALELSNAKIALQKAINANALANMKIEKKEESTKGALQVITEQIQKVVAGTQDLKGAWQSMSQASAFAISDGIGGALMNIIDGTKSTKEAFADMARSMLRWLGEIIIKQQILNTLKGFSLFGFGSAHTGGVAGKDVPKFGGGGVAGGTITRSSPSSDNIPAMLRKNEVIFTPEQMKVLGSVMSGGGKTPVQILNNYDGATFMDRRQLTDIVTTIASQVATVITQTQAPGAIINAYNNDHPIRDIIRSGI